MQRIAIMGWSCRAMTARTIVLASMIVSSALFVPLPIIASLWIRRVKGVGARRERGRRSAAFVQGEDIAFAVLEPCAARIIKIDDAIDGFEFRIVVFLKDHTALAQ